MKALLKHYAIVSENVAFGVVTHSEIIDTVTAYRASQVWQLIQKRISKGEYKGLDINVRELH